MTLSLQETQKILSLCHFPGYSFEVRSADGSSLSLYLQAKFAAPCSASGRVEQQHTRKWQLSPHMTRSELIQTAFKCVLTSVEHEAREQFSYRGQAIYGPHLDAEKLVGLCQTEHLDARS